MLPNKHSNDVNTQLRQNLLDQLADFVIAVDAKGYIIFWNHQAERFFSYTSKDVIGQPLRQLLAQEPYQNLNAISNQVSDQEVWEGDLAFISPNGERLWAFTRIRPLSLSNDNVGRIFQGTSLIDHEIRHHRVQSALDYSQRELSNILSSVGDLVCSYNLNTQTFNFVSPSCLQLTGYTEHEMMDQPALFLEMVKPEHRKSVINALQATEDGTIHRVEYPIIRKDGEERWVLNSLTPIFEEGHIRLICALTDTTAYRELNELKSRMIRMATHDLNNPLSTAVGFFGLLADDIIQSLSDEHQMMVQSIHRSHDRMAKMLEELLDFEQVDSSLQLNLEEVDLIDIIRSLLEEFDFQVQEKEHHIYLNCDHASMFVHVDRAQIEHAVANYISNAIKYTPDGGQIEIQVRKEDHRLIYEVQDNGIGVPEKHRDQLFTTFYRVKQPGTEHIPGTGLGLSLVKSVVKQHRGDVYYRPEDPGSTFGFWLPLQDRTSS